jgi:1A family penicillin-binding protein
MPKSTKITRKSVPKVKKTPRASRSLKRKLPPPSTRTIKIKHASGTIFDHSLINQAFNRISQWRKHSLHLLSQMKTQPTKKSKRSRKSQRKLEPRALVRKVTYPGRVFVSSLASYPWRTAVSLGMTICIVATSYWLYTNVFKDLPSPSELRDRRQPLTTTILDRHGKVLYRIYEDENRSLVPLSQVPDYMVKATIAIEDQEFYSHHGFSVRGITRATMANLKGETVQGGSTITQQLVKNRLLSPEKTLARKLREVLLAILVEGSYSKDEILEMYLNQVAYGGSTYGIEAASHQYFNKSAKDLTLAEAALLAGLPQAPSIYSPFGPTPDLASQRQTEVLRRMVEDEYISQDQADEVLKQPLTFRTNTIDIQAPHFVMYVKKILAETYGEDVVNQGGLEVRTTLDLDLQKSAQEVVTNEVGKLEKLRISNGAALVTNPQDGEILAMIGSTNYFDFEHDGQVNVTIRPRQPGSSIKPLTYAMALERGMTPSSTIDDTPITFTIPGSKPYSPKNYDGKAHGKVTLREALASSYNISAVKLLNLIGVNNLIDKGQSMGISTWQDRQRFGLSLTLGGGEVLMTDMAELYSTFANYGYTMDLNPLLEVKDASGSSLYRNRCALDNEACPKRKTLDTRVAYQITDILSDNQARTPAFGPRSVLTIPNQQVAVKTGTTNNLDDNWAIGYTSDRLVAVWVGNNDGSHMSYVASGVTGASPIWNDIMQLLLDENSPHRFATPDGLIKVAICTRTGTLPCRGCPSVREELFVPGTEPKAACSPRTFVPRSKPSATPGATPASDQQASRATRDRLLTGVSY